MANLPEQKRSRWFLPELSDLFADFPSWTGLRPLFESHLIRLEEEVEDGHYVVRAEIPRVDPAQRRRHHRAGRHPDDQGRTYRDERNQGTVGVLLRARLPAQSRSRRAPMRRTSRPPTTRAFSPFLWRFPNRARRPRSTSLCRRPADPDNRRPRSCSGPSPQLVLRRP
jgi:hypothetical protein